MACVSFDKTSGMELRQDLSLIGASTRAAAFSALRAGLRPWCADLFADIDLQRRSPVERLSPEKYPRGFLRAAQGAPAGPWMYMGGLENHPGLIRRIGRIRPLWGNDESVLRIVRSPLALAQSLGEVELPVPAVRVRLDEVPANGRWLVKPLRGSGGGGIQFLGCGVDAPSRRRAVYFQEFIEGASLSAIYLGDGRVAQFLGATQQLVGEPWLHAGPFHYCGSLGPLALAPTLRKSLERLGDAITAASGLRGLFGVDCILQDELPWLVEVNPRYTASMEILEYAGCGPLLRRHRSIFDPSAPAQSLAPVRQESVCIGKAILFAARPLIFPADGPWITELMRPTPIDAMPGFADLPSAGERIEVGRPILTLFARGRSLEECRETLRRTAADLDRCLFRR